MHTLLPFINPPVCANGFFQARRLELRFVSFVNEDIQVHSCQLGPEATVAKKTFCTRTWKLMSAVTQLPISARRMKEGGGKGDEERRKWRTMKSVRNLAH